MKKKLLKKQLKQKKVTRIVTAARADEIRRENSKSGEIDHRSSENTLPVSA